MREFHGDLPSEDRISTAMHRERTSDFGPTAPPGPAAGQAVAGICATAQRETKRGAACRGVLGPDAAAVRVDHRSRDRQTHSHAIGLGGEKRFEQLRHAGGRDAVAAVAHGDFHEAIVLSARGHDQLACSLGRVLHGIHAVHDEDHQHLFDGRTVAGHARQAFGQVVPNRHAPVQRVARR